MSQPSTVVLSDLKYGKGRSATPAHRAPWNSDGAVDQAGRQPAQRIASRAVLQNEEGAKPYAITAEAHALRFAAGTSAGINSWNPKVGSVDIGVQISAAFSMAEASAAAEV